MNHITLEEIENNFKKTPKKSIGEIKIIAIIFIFIFLLTFIFSNAQLIIHEFQNIFGDTSLTKNELTKENNKILGFLKKNSTETDNSEILMEISKIQNSKGINNNSKNENIVELNLEEKIDNYQFEFNLLPPNNRLIIEKLGLDVPLIQSKIIKEDGLTKDDFNDELKSGVVQYPTTPEPGNYGNTLIYGHSSQEWWKKNKYGTIFAGLPKIETGDIIQIIREGKLYEYETIDKTIIYPKDVPEYYNTYQDQIDDFITLMGCYPIGKDTKRILIVTKRKYI